VLTGGWVTLRELRTDDAASLFALLTTEEVARFISPPPSSVEGFEKFIEWTLRQRTAGTYACFAVTLKGFDTAIGIFQVRAGDAGFETAEWGFAVGSAFWGTGVFQEGAELLHQPDLLAYFESRLQSMPEFNLKLLQDIRGALLEVRPLIDVGEAHISPASVKKINEITTRVGDAITKKSP
jgi:hypothetical protein